MPPSQIHKGAEFTAQTLHVQKVCGKKLAIVPHGLDASVPMQLGFKGCFLLAIRGIRVPSENPVGLLLKELG